MGFPFKLLIQYKVINIAAKLVADAKKKKVLKILNSDKEAVAKVLYNTEPGITELDIPSREISIARRISLIVKYNSE